MLPERAEAFVAYSSHDADLCNLINNGIDIANQEIRGQLRYHSWQINEISGTPLVSPIIENIEKSIFVVADITYLNLNVVYEIGLAIGKGRRCILIRHKTTDGDKVIATQAGIFDTLGYDSYDDSRNLADCLTARVNKDPLPIANDLDRSAPVYIVQPQDTDGISTVMISRIKKARYKYRSFNPGEDARLSAMDAIRQVAVSSGVLVYIQTSEKVHHKIDNVRALFVAGLAAGMEKPCLVLANKNTLVPLDIRDDTRSFARSEDINDFIAKFSLEVTEYLQGNSSAAVNRSPTRLQALSVGDPTAENEMSTLGEYFLATDQYSKALRGEANLVVGRKGTGKTALFIQIRDKKRADKRNIVLDLRPEGYQLIKLKEDVLSYLTDGSGRHLITAFWEYLILLEITYKLLEKDRNIYKNNHEIFTKYIDLEKTYNAEDYSVQGDFSERLLALSQRISQDYRREFGRQRNTKLLSENVTQLVYSHDVKQLQSKVIEYLKAKREVWVLFDNLDKGWNTQGVDKEDTLILRCLIDAGRKIERDMRRGRNEVHCIIFIRNDVYEHLMEDSADYGKEMKVALDWTDPDMLREFMRLRLVSGLDDVGKGAKFDDIWPSLCVSHYLGEETSEYMIVRSLMRPRNFLKIFTHAKGFAVNLGHASITEDDLKKGVGAYSQDLMVELDHELTDVFPDAKDILYGFIDSNPRFDEIELKTLINRTQIGQDKVQEVIDYLLYYGILGIASEPNRVRYIFDVRYDLKLLKMRAERVGSSVKYVLNPAFRAALEVADEP